MKFSVIRDGLKKRNINCTDMKSEEYDKILKKSKEFLAAEKGLGPYVGFGLSEIHGKPTIAIGEWSPEFVELIVCAKGAQKQQTP